MCEIFKLHLRRVPDYDENASFCFRCLTVQVFNFTPAPNHLRSEQDSRNTKIGVVQNLCKYFLLDETDLGYFGHFALNWKFFRESERAKSGRHQNSGQSAQYCSMGQDELEIPSFLQEWPSYLVSSIVHPNGIRHVVLFTILFI
ncbi:unnamed protein product [Orchesella dallaii]|uniref:Uncharacterized protein n=1 Tax=Orchesella dallaii TaxID=48710 RepID=A0ABP1RNR1_9HEXA